LGGALRRHEKFSEKGKKFDSGAYIQFCSNLFYQKFLGKTTPRPASAGRGRKPVGSGAKNFLWGVGQKEIFCALAT